MKHRGEIEQPRENGERSPKAVIAAINLLIAWILELEDRKKDNALIDSVTLTEKTEK